MHEKLFRTGRVPARGLLQSLCAILLTGFFLAGCAQKPLQPPAADYAQSAIRLHFKASRDLNVFRGQAHALVLCVYQLSNPEVFQDKLQEPNGPNRLLACDHFDASVTARKRVIVQPARAEDVILDRVQGTRYVGIIAGYYERGSNDFYKVVPIPTKLKRSGLFKKKAFLDVLELNVHLDDRGMK